MSVREKKNNFFLFNIEMPQIFLCRIQLFPPGKFYELSLAKQLVSEPMIGADNYVCHLKGKKLKNLFITQIIYFALALHFLGS